MYILHLFELAGVKIQEVLREYRWLHQQMEAMSKNGIACGLSCVKAFDVAEISHDAEEIVAQALSEKLVERRIARNQFGGKRITTHKIKTFVKNAQAQCSIDSLLGAKASSAAYWELTPYLEALLGLPFGSLMEELCVQQQVEQPSSIMCRLFATALVCVALAYLLQNESNSSNGMNPSNARKVATASKNAMAYVAAEEEADKNVWYRWGEGKNGWWLFARQYLLKHSALFIQHE